MKIAVPIDKNYDISIEKEGKFKLICRTSPESKTIEELEKRFKERDVERQSKLTVPPIKIYRGGGVSPK